MENQSVFVEYFGASPMIKVLDFLIEGRMFDYSMTEIAKKSEVGWSSFSRIWKKLADKKIVVQTRKIGNAKLFRLNIENPWVKELIRMDKVITDLETEKFLSENKEIPA